MEEITVKCQLKGRITGQIVVFTAPVATGPFQGINFLFALAIGKRRHCFDLAVNGYDPLVNGPVMAHIIIDPAENILPCAGVIDQLDFTAPVFRLGYTEQDRLLDLFDIIIGQFFIEVVIHNGI